MKVASLLLALSLCFAAHATPIALPELCAAAVGRLLPNWKFIEVPPDAAKWAKDRRLNPTVTRGDFNADGHADHGALVTVDGVPHLAVCISRGRTVELLVVERPYCSDMVFRSKARKWYYNFETDRHEMRPRDGVSVSCFEKAGATYMYDKGTMRRVVDSD